MNNHIPKLLILVLKFLLFHVAIIIQLWLQVCCYLIILIIFKQSKHGLKGKGGVYTAGANEYYQLGRDNREDTRRFNKVEDIDESAKYLSCGGGHTVLITTS